MQIVEKALLKWFARAIGFFLIGPLLAYLFGFFNYLDSTGIHILVSLMLGMTIIGGCWFVNDVRKALKVK